ncbi:ABC transporter substrate-binding protein [Thioclava sp. SK-1]|uniref:TRAP transporter substrate-binding protein n=1 Tax=Thioclava sp. SK-1 TaxID=1889770 RepID=UPI0008265D5F|nr:TRAP transporter substrate-binding protein [Thioclava sp. SK-1]OCX66218.1 ABC transporter substrate-binding protein [Thioclava sp. SK-1]
MFAKLSIAALALGATLATAASAEQIKFASFMPAGHPYVGSTFQPLADQIAEGTDGDLTVKLYNGGELGAGPVEQYSRVVDGVTELAVSLPGYTASQFPLTLLAELPGVLDEQSGNAVLNANLDLLASEYRRAHLVALWSSAENILFTADKPVHSPGDLAGLKIRVPSRNTGLLVEAWGGSAVSMPVSEIYNAMQTGVIDGAMIDGTGINAFKLGEVANYVTIGMNTTISPFFILMNRDTYGDLSDADKAAVDAAGAQAAVNGHAMQLDVAAKGIAGFKATEGKTVIQLTDDEAAAFDALSADVVDTVVKDTGGDAAKIVAALQSK